MVPTLSVGCLRFGHVQRDSIGSRRLFRKRLAGKCRMRVCTPLDSRFGRAWQAGPARHPLLMCCPIILTPPSTPPPRRQRWSALHRTTVHFRQITTSVLVPIPALHELPTPLHQTCCLLDSLAERGKEYPSSYSFKCAQGCS